MRVGIFAKPHRVDVAEALREAIGWLRERNCEVLVERSVVEIFQLDDVDAAVGDQIPTAADILIVFGGDGTILSVARRIGRNRCPILGVNLGSLGFLTEVALSELFPALENVLAGRYRVQSRGMLQAELSRGGKPVETHHALNDVVINKAALARVICVEAYSDDRFLSAFVADGIIVATPTGSTAYSLSAGGPIVDPELNSILLTPICPHTLTNRPLVLPPERRLRFVLQAGDDVMVTIDGQVGRDLKRGDEVVCTQSPYRVEMIQPQDISYFDVLRAKLKWGER
ncbi:MAG TPA: NAD(+)/NADH kinase [Acidobacteriota bacterium]|nr:NAD(+)/NADH kinase [Acidobacteriota bacterium]